MEEKTISQMILSKDDDHLDYSGLGEKYKKEENTYYVISLIIGEYSNKEEEPILVYENIGWANNALGKLNNYKKNFLYICKLYRDNFITSDMFNKLKAHLEDIYKVPDLLQNLNAHEVDIDFKLSEIKQNKDILRSKDIFKIENVLNPLKEREDNAVKEN